ncbi:hypothetical protein PIB30_085458, partial [Stylosanthes scabra]|nr:hypothetical protein [Stylosanthes scabra]
MKLTKLIIGGKEIKSNPTKYLRINFRINLKGERWKLGAKVWIDGQDQSSTKREIQGQQKGGSSTTLCSAKSRLAMAGTHPQPWPLLCQLQT